MKKITLTVSLLCTWIIINAQANDTLNQEVSPAIGINQLAIKYYGIEFDKEQREKIQNQEIELIFLVDEKGNPTLSEINGVMDKIILDSLRNKTTEIGKFNPSIQNGRPVSSIYFVKLTFPSYRFTQSKFGIIQGQAYNEAKLEDFEYIIESKERLDLIVGGALNQPIGRPSEYLALGAGMGIDIAFTAKNKMIYGLNMRFFQNRLKKEYPINTTRTQFERPTTAFFSVGVGRWFNTYNIQGEFGFAVQNITEKLHEDDQDWVQLDGWTVGVLMNYPIKIGKSNPQYYYGSPSLFENNINLHVGLRYVKLSIKEATGLMTELGLSYRFTVKGINKYKLKEE